MKRPKSRDVARAILAGLTVVTFTIPTADGLVCSRSAGRVAEMQARQRQMVNPLVRTRAEQRCAHLSCCRARAFTASIPAMPFALGRLPVTQELSPRALSSRYFTFLPTSPPPPRA